MRALRWHAAADVRLADVPAPELLPGTALVRVSFCGVCGTDLHEFRAGPSLIRSSPHPLSGQAPPVTLGHEISGQVIALEGTPHGIAVGTRVAVDPCLRCGHCYWCRRGEYHICQSGGSIGLACDGGFAEVVRVPLECLHAVPDGVDDRSAALAEPLAVGLHAARRAEVRAGDNVLVIGAGPIGIASVLGALACGAAHVMVSEPNAQRRMTALTAGASEAFDPESSDVRRETFLRTGRVGPDAVIDATGNAAAIAFALNTVRRGGRVAVAGIKDQDMRLDLRHLVLYERSVVGSLGYNFDIPRVLELIATGRLDPTPMLAEPRPLSAWRETFEELATGATPYTKLLFAPQEA